MSPLPASSADAQATDTRSSGPDLVSSKPSEKVTDQREIQHPPEDKEQDQRHDQSQFTGEVHSQNKKEAEDGTPPASNSPVTPKPNFFGEFFGFALKNAGLTEAELRGGHATPHSSEQGQDSSQLQSAASSLPLEYLASDGHGLDCGTGAPPPNQMDALLSQSSSIQPGAQSATASQSLESDPPLPLPPAASDLMKQLLDVLSAHEAAPQVPEGSRISRVSSQQEQHGNDAQQKQKQPEKEGVRASSLTRALHKAAHAPRQDRSLDLPAAPVTDGGVPDSGAMTPGTPSIDQHGLGWPAARTLDRLNFTPAAAAANEARLAGAVSTILQCLGEDPKRPGLKETPVRYAKALLWMTRGYETKLDGTLSAERTGVVQRRRVGVTNMPSCFA